MNSTSHCFNDVTDSFYNLNEDSTSSSQNNDSTIGYSSYHIGHNNNVVGNINSTVDLRSASEIAGFNNCDGHTAETHQFENSFHIQYEQQAISFKTHRLKYDEMVVDNGYRKPYALYDNNQTFMNDSSEQTVTVMNEKINQHSDISDLSLTYQQQYMEPCFNYVSNDMDSNVTYKIALDSGQ